VLLQLQQVPAAGESSEVSMKYQQEPLTLVIREAMDAAFAIGQFEGNRRPANLTSSNGWCHGSILVCRRARDQRTSPYGRARRAAGTPRR
jgi:hypothetical protein